MLDKRQTITRTNPHRQHLRLAVFWIVAALLFLAQVTANVLHAPSLDSLASSNTQPNPPSLLTTTGGSRMAPSLLRHQARREDPTLRASHGIDHNPNGSTDHAVVTAPSLSGTDTRTRDTTKPAELIRIIGSRAAWGHAPTGPPTV